MEGLPSAISKLTVEVLNRQYDEDNLFSWKLTWSRTSFSLPSFVNLNTNAGKEKVTTNKRVILITAGYCRIPQDTAGSLDMGVFNGIYHIITWNRHFIISNSKHLHFISLVNIAMQ